MGLIRNGMSQMPAMCNDKSTRVDTVRGTYVLNWVSDKGRTPESITDCLTFGYPEPC